MMRDSSLLVRTAEQGDVKSIVKMCKSSMAATYGSFMSLSEMRPWIEGRETDHYVEGMIQKMIVAEQTKGVVGVACINEDVIDLVWVDANCRGEGIGQQLMEAAERIIKLDGFDEAKVECFEPNEGAIKFYELCGYGKKDRYADPVAKVDKVLLVKNVEG